MVLRRWLRVRSFVLLATTLQLLAAAFSVSVLFAPLATNAQQTVPYLINFQGKLSDSSGNILADGSYNIKFRLYTVATGGSNVWEEDRVAGSPDHRITVQNGLFNIQLGSVTTLSASLFDSYTEGNLYLEVELPTPSTATCATSGCAVWTEGAMTPRQPLASSPYAINADNLGGLSADSYGQLSATQTWTGTNTYSASGAAAVVLSGNAASGGSLLQIGGALSGGSAAGTLFGANTTTSADLLNLQSSSSTKLKVDNTGNITDAGNLEYTSGLDHSLTVAPAASGSGNNLSIVAGQSGAGANNGGDLFLEAGATGGTGTAGSVVVKANGVDSATAFQVQTAGGPAVLTANTINNSLSVNTPTSDATLTIKADALHTVTVAYSIAGTTSLPLPADVTNVTVKAWGAGGGGGAGSGGTASGGSGGGGGFSEATVPATGGSTLSVDVGSGGIKAPTNEFGGSGGGFSGVQLGSNYLIQAGGGGGGGGALNNTNSAGAGGAGGGASGVAGSNGAGTGPGLGGQPGTVSSGGAGGTGGSGTGAAGIAEAGGDAAGSGATCATNTGNTGSGGTGGGGAQGSAATCENGGGGGGGNYGGGGGGSANGNNRGGGGGGGGSDLVMGSGTTETQGSGTTPANNTDADYVASCAASAGTGGTGTTSSTTNTVGQPGCVVVSYQTAANNPTTLSVQDSSGDDTFKVLANGDASFENTTDNTDAFQVQSAEGDPMLTVDTSNNNLVVGGAGGPTPTLLVIDSAASDPATGSNGAEYYNTSSDTFRCFQDNAWTNCITAPDSVTATANAEATYMAGRANMTASQTGLALNTFGVTSATAFALNTAGDDATTFTAPEAGSFRSCVVMSDGIAVTAGTLSLRWRDNGTSVGAPACTLSTSATLSATSAIDSGVTTFNAGDSIGVAFDSSSTFAPATADYTVYYTVEYDSSSGNGLTEQFVYDSSSSPATINLSDGKDLVVNATDTTTDPNIIDNLECTTSCGSNGRFAIQNGGTDVFTVSPDGGGIAMDDNTTLGSGDKLTLNGGTLSDSGNIQTTGSGSITSAGTLTVGSFAASSSTPVCSNAGTLATCSGVPSATTLQQAYGNGNTIGTSGNDIAFTLNASQNFTVTTTAGAIGSTTFALANGANTSPPPQLVLVTNLDTTHSIADGVKVSTAGGVITTAFDASGSGITNALAIGANAISGTHFSVASTGAVTSVGVNAGTGSIQGSGGLAVTGNSTIAGTLGSVTSLTLSGAISGGTTYSGSGSITSTGGTVSGTGLTASAGPISGTSTSATADANTLTDVSFLQTSASTASLLDNTFTDGATNTTGTTTTNGLIINSAVNTSGAGSKNINAISAAAPTLTACTSGACTLDGVRVSTIASGAAATVTSNGLDVEATTIAAGALNGLNIAGLAANANTGQTAINIGSNWNNVLVVGGTPVINGAGQIAGGQLQAGTVGNGALASSSISTSFTGLTGSASVSLGGTMTLATAYGSTASTAVQGNDTIVCPTTSGNLSGSGNTVTLGANGNCGAITLSATPSFTSEVLSGSGAAATPVLNLSGSPYAGATTSLVQLGGAIASGNANPNGGTYLGINLPGSGSGSAADFLNFQKANTVEFKVDNAGNGTLGGSLSIGSGQNYEISGTQISSANLSNSSSITTQGNTFNGNTELVETNGTGQLPAISGNLLTNINASNIIQGSGAVTLESANTDNLVLESGSTGTASLDSATTGNVTVGNGASAKTVTIGNNTGTTMLNLESGTNGINLGDDTISKEIDIAGVTSAGTDTVDIGTNAASIDTINIGNTNSTTAITLQAGSNDITLDTATGNSVDIGSGATSDANQTLLNLDSYNVFADTSSCTGGANEGALYYNTSSNTIRGCVNNNWEDVVTTSGLGVILFGVVPDSTATTGTGDLAGADGYNSGPCKVYLTGTANIIGWNSCQAYSAGRKIQVTAGTATVSATASVYQNLCLTGANQQPALVGTANATETTAALFPAFSVNNPILCLAEIKTATATSHVADIYDTRTFTTDTKTFATVATTLALGSMVHSNGTIGQFVPTSAATQQISGVVVAYSGTVSTTTPNAIIVTAGPVAVKDNAIAGQVVGDVIEWGTLTGGVGYGTAIAPATTATDPYTYAGVAVNTYSGVAAGCTVSTVCNGSLFTTLEIR